MLSFCCNQCGNIQNCRHKRTTAQAIRFQPTDARTAHELRTSQQHEREQVWADMVAHRESTSYEINPEQPEFVEEQLIELEKEISLLHSNEKLEFEQALTMENGGDYVTSKSFRLSFLRADRFHAKDAARRLVSHLKLKKELFGVESLCRDITVNDLTSDERDVLNDGPYRFLPEKDHAGRYILFSRAAKADFDRPEKNFRVLWVLVNTIAKDNEDFQKLGCVNIPYMLDGYPENANFDFFRQAVRFFKSSPIRLVAIYSLVDSSAWMQVLELANYCIGKIVRLRTRSIHGSPQECIYSLLCLGFTSSNIPKELFEADGVEGEGSNKKRKRRDPHHPMQQQPQQSMGVARIVEDD